jgi:hypothetical protein
MRIHFGKQAKSTYSISGEVHSGAESPMKQRGTQFDPRKNPASPRVHGSRLAVNSSSLRSATQTANSSESKPSPQVERFGLPSAEGYHL